MTDTLDLLGRWLNPLHLSLFQDILFIFAVGVTFTLVLPFLGAMLLKTKNADGKEDDFVTRFRIAKVHVFGTVLVLTSLGLFVAGIVSVSVGQWSFAGFLFVTSVAVVVTMLYLLQNSKKE